MNEYPEKIANEEQLEELLSRPGRELVEMIARTDGDILFLGITGKIGPSLAMMAARACDKGGVKKRIIGVSRHQSEEQRRIFNSAGIETITGDLLDDTFLKSLPKVKNVFFLAGMKFGSTENLSLTWAINTYLPGLVAENFRDSRIVVFSTGCVYPLVNPAKGGSVETDKPLATGEYAQSCLGRERMFEYGSKRYGTPVILIRLNYSVEMRYGVLVDIAQKVWNEQPVDLTMGYFNIIWQGDMNDYVLRSLDQVSSPARVLNVTGPEILSVHKTALKFGELMNKEPFFIGQEADTALLSNSGEAFKLFGKPRIATDRIIEWTADWIMEGRRLLGKPTHFEERDGKY
ncbi:MAG TPA: NAD-dependent epimerase/dehydratase family protein [Bacteroidales bacterium]|nr:NAD-dependent epimerase/dehydratase family protein [Bacteroidales bacterium]HPR73004.1 NAD-dependent epimerase/dehydratase family protein [Bacteroidales bacterium]